MRLRYRQFKYIAFTVAAIITLFLWAYAFLNGASVIDWTIQSERGFGRAWNYAISREGTVQVTGMLAIFVLFVILVDRRREKGINRYRELRERVWRRRLERARDRGDLPRGDTSMLPPPVTAAEERQESKALPVRLTVLDSTPVSYTLSPTGRLSKSEKGDKVALVDFYREVDSSSAPSIQVRAHVEFYDLSGTRLARINDGFWHEEHKDLTQGAQFRVADSRKLLIAVSDRKSLRVFDGRLVFHRMGFRGFNEFILTGEPLEGKDFIVRVRLISVKGSETILDDALSFRLSTEPQLVIEQIDEDKSFELGSLVRVRREETPRKQPNIVRKGTQDTRLPIDPETNRFTATKFRGEKHNLVVQLAKFYYAPEPNTPDWVEVTAHIKFYAGAELIYEAFSPVWFGQESSKQRFERASAHELIIAVGEESFGSYECVYQKRDGQDVCFGRYHAAFERDFRAQVELIIERDQDITTKTFNYEFVRWPKPGHKWALNEV